VAGKWARLVFWPWMYPFGGKPPKENCGSSWLCEVLSQALSEQRDAGDRVSVPSRLQVWNGHPSVRRKRLVIPTKLSVGLQPTCSIPNSAKQGSAAIQLCGTVDRWNGPLGYAFTWGRGPRRNARGSKVQRLSATFSRTLTPFTES
jgi:hypothetical protein